MPRRTPLGELSRYEAARRDQSWNGSDLNQDKKTQSNMSDRKPRTRHSRSSSTPQEPLSDRPLDQHIPRRRTSRPSRIQPVSGDAAKYHKAHPASRIPPERVCQRNAPVSQLCTDLTTLSIQSRPHQSPKKPSKDLETSFDVYYDPYALTYGANSVHTRAMCASHDSDNKENLNLLEIEN